jgi:hypothetical protein
MTPRDPAPDGLPPAAWRPAGTCLLCGWHGEDTVNNNSRSRATGHPLPAGSASYMALESLWQARRAIAAVGGDDPQTFQAARQRGRQPGRDSRPASATPIGIGRRSRGWFPDVRHQPRSYNDDGHPS